MLMFGREMHLPVDLVYGPHPQIKEYPDETGVIYEYTDDLQKRLWKVHAKARDNIVKASDRQKRQYDIKANINSFKVSDVVWLFKYTRVKNRSPKLQRNWDGPYFITEVISDIIYRKNLTDLVEIL